MIHSRKEISPAALLAVLLLVTGCASHGPSVRSEAEAPTDSIAENDNSLSGSGNLVARDGICGGFGL